MPTIPIRRPLQVHGVRTPDEYRALQQHVLDRLRAARPTDAASPWLATETPDVYVSDGTWMLRCSCGNCVAVDLDWRLGCCFECGARYESVDGPADAPAIEAALMARPDRYTRVWRAPETVADLIEENACHGLG